MSSNYLEVYTIIPPQRDGDKSRWVRIGTAWRNKDGSTNVALDALPTNGKLQIREPQPREDRG